MSFSDRRWASQIGSGLSGVLYVLDEPSIGLHQRDNDMLLATLRRLRDLGNTVLVVEHDEDAIRTADYVIDMGPGAGVHGGEIVAKGTLKQILKAKGSVTADYLNGTREVPVPAKRRKGNGKKLTVSGATANNLKNVTASIPLGTFTCITGVSGSGKSSFTLDTLYAAAARHLKRCVQALNLMLKLLHLGETVVRLPLRGNELVAQGFKVGLEGLQAGVQVPVLAMQALHLSLGLKKLIAGAIVIGRC